MIRLHKKKSLDSILGVFTKTLSELSDFQDDLNSEKSDLLTEKLSIEKRLYTIESDNEKAKQVQEKIKNILGE